MFICSCPPLVTGRLFFVLAVYPWDLCQLNWFVMIYKIKFVNLAKNKVYFQLCKDFACHVSMSTVIYNLKDQHVDLNLNGQQDWM